MNTQVRIQQVLSRTVGELAKLSSEAAAIQDFAGSSLANTIAVRVAQLANEHDTAVTSTSEERPRPKGGRGGRRSESRLKRGWPPKGDYPKFYVRNGTLFRVGWSKTGGAEYVHKVSRAAFDQIIQALVKVAEKGSGPHAVEEITEQLQRRGADIPGYQMYVALGMLHQEACVQKTGREGYTIAQTLDQMAGAAWEHCEQRRP